MSLFLNPSDKLALYVLHLLSPHLFDRTEIAECSAGQHLTAASLWSLVFRVKPRARYTLGLNICIYICPGMIYVYPRIIGYAPSYLTWNK